MTEQIEEQAALYVIDLLEGEEKRIFEEQLSRSAELQRVVDELREAAAALAHTAPARLPPPDLEAKIAAAVRAHKPAARQLAPSPWLPWAMAAALVLFCGVLLFDRASMSRRFTAAREQIASANVERDRATRLAVEKDRQAAEAQSETEKLRSEREDLLQQVARWQELEQAMRIQNATLAENRQTLEKKVADLERLGALSQLRVVPMTAKLPSAAGAAATIVWDPEKQQGILSAANVPVLAPDKDYQLWLVDPAYQQPVDAGVFRVDEKGATTFTFHPKLRITSATAFAVSLERVSLTTWEMRARLRRLLGSAACLACWFLRPAETGSEQRLPQRRKFAMARRHSPSRETRALPKPRAARTQSHSSM